MQIVNDTHTDRPNISGKNDIETVKPKFWPSVAFLEFQFLFGQS